MQEDEAGVIYVEYIGAVETAQVIRYGADSVIVSKMPEPGEEPVCQPTEATINRAFAALKLCWIFDNM